jgi:salicylate hydroxylase
MLDALVELLPQGVAQLNKRCVSVQPAGAPGGKAVVHFEDGSQYQADVIVGCDGIRSVVRDAVAQGSSTTRYMNTVAYRGLFPISNLKTFRPNELECPRLYAGIDKVMFQLLSVKASLFTHNSTSYVSPSRTIRW